MTSNSSKSFERRIFMACIPSNLFAGLVIYLYTITIVQMDRHLWGAAFVVVVSIVLGCQIMTAPLTNILVSRRLSRSLEEWRKDGLSIQERTELLFRLLAYPKRKKLECNLYFSIGTGILALGYIYFLKLGWMDIIACVTVCLFCTHLVGVLEFFTSVRLCSEYARKVVEQGVDQEMIRRQRALGLTFGQSFFQLVAFPSVLTTVLFAITYTSSYLGNGGRIDGEAMSLICVAVVVNIVASLILTLVFFATVFRSSRMLQDSMEHITRNDIFTVEPSPTDMVNEISYNMYLANNIIRLFQSVLTRIRSVGRSLLPAIDELQQIVDKATALSFQQSASVQEMVATVEESESQIRELDKRIFDLADTAAVIVRHLDEGGRILAESMEKMDEISRSNRATISGIWTLGEKINGVWDIVSTINSIAERTRIIGFNAELRAAETGSTGNNFLIIANEIKRLAGSIADAVVVIQERISEVQASSDNLVISSEGGTERVREEGELGRSLAGKLEEVSRSMDITGESMQNIALIARQQFQGIHHISRTVGRIAEGIEEVSASMGMVTDITEGLKNTAYRLENLSTEIVQSEGIHAGHEPVQAQEKAGA